MYQPLLTSRYLSTRMIPFLAVAAVALSVALVTVVISVMTGFLDMIRESGRTLMGDVVISYPLSGIPYYEELIEQIEAMPEAAAATPVVDTWGLLRMPYPEGDAKASQQIQIWGIEAASFDRVTEYSDTLKWATIPDDAADWVMLDAMRKLTPSLVARLDESHQVVLLQLTDHGEFDDWSDEALADFINRTRAEDLQWPLRLTSLLGSPEDLRKVVGEDGWARILETDPRLATPNRVTTDGLTLQRNGEAAIVPGLHVSRENWRMPDGEFWIGGGGHWWMPRFDATLTTLPIDSRGGLLEPESLILPIANEFTSGVFLIDETRVMVPLDIVQRMTHLNEAELVDELDPMLVVGKSPARATMVLVRAVDGVSPIDLRLAVESVYAEFADGVAARGGDVLPPVYRAEPTLRINTWEEQNARFIGPVEKERGLMRLLFSIVYLVCGALVVAIFWAIVYEKTRDIGILRSVGASRLGIISIFVLYGLVVGILGGLSGVALGWLTMSNMPTIHEALSNPPIWLGIMLLALGVLLGGLGAVRSVAASRLNTRRLGIMLGLAVGLTATDAGLVLGWLIRVNWLAHMPNPPIWVIVVMLAMLPIGITVIALQVRGGGCRRLLPTWLGVLAAFVLGLLGFIELLFAIGGGVVLWDPAVYYFNEIPSQLDWPSAWLTAGGAALCSVVAASIPAARAADIDPVGALRYE